MSVVSIDNLHVGLSITTLIVLAVAGGLALLLATHAYTLQHKKHDICGSNWLSVATLEKIVFGLVTVGFVLLSLLLLTSVYAFYPLLLHSAHDVFLQKTILTVISWLIFFGLLIGRYGYGLRGKRAIIAIIVAFGLLLIIYLGSHLVTGVVL